LPFPPLFRSGHDKGRNLCYNNGIHFSKEADRE